MDPMIVGLIGLGLMIVLFAIGLPIGLSLALTGFSGLAYMISFEAAVNKIAISSFETITNYSLGTLPLYILMAQVIFASGMGTSIYDVASKFIGHLRGGLCMATICGCAGFSAISSSSIATITTMGMVALPEMDKYQYNKKMSLGAIAAAGGLGILIPPSGVLIIYGVITETSIGKLFTAGIIPGIILALFFMATIFILCRFNPEYGPPGPTSTLKEKAKSIYNCFDIILLIILVLGGIFIGLFTPTESAGVGAFGTIVLSFIRKRINLKQLEKCFFDTCITVGMLYLLMVGSFIFMYFIAVSTLPIQLANIIEGLDMHPYAIIAFMVGFYFILGTSMDAMSMILLTMPVFFPIVIELGYSPIWFGIIIVVVAEISMITPPIGANVFALKAVAMNESMSTMYLGITPFLIASILFTILLVIFPQITTFLPDLMK